MRRFVLRACAPLTLMVAVLGAPREGATQRFGAPMDLLLDVCVLPADDCPSTRDIMDLTVEGKTLKVGILRTEILRGSVPGTGTVQTELTLRPMRAVGPEETLQRLKPGAKLRVRASTRLSDRMMLVSSVEPSKEK